jgi:hypothetical protein
LARECVSRVNHWERGDDYNARLSASSNRENKSGVRLASPTRRDIGMRRPESDATAVHRKRLPEQSEIKLPTNGHARKATIRVSAERYSENVDEIETALLAAGALIYSRAGRLVRPVSEAAPAAHGKITQIAKMVEVTRPYLIDEMASVAEFERFDRRTGAWVTRNPPGDRAEILLAREGEWNNADTAAGWHAFGQAGL